MIVKNQIKKTKIRLENLQTKLKALEKIEIVDKLVDVWVRSDRKGITFRFYKDIFRKNRNNKKYIYISKTTDYFRTSWDDVLTFFDSLLNEIEKEEIILEN